MDRYTDLHLLSQEQMETIVQLEATAEMDLGIRDFSYATRNLQQNVTRSQMRPFSELVGRFPRLISDLSNKHNKQVDLKIEGETTYIDGQALDLLSDPLTHLLRNAFDHGLEDAANFRQFDCSVTFDLCLTIFIVDRDRSLLFFFNYNLSSDRIVVSFLSH